MRATTRTAVRRPVHRALGLTLVGTALLGLGVAAASRLDVTGGAVASGAASVERCDGLVAVPVHEPTADGFGVTAVEVTDAAGTCGGAHVEVRLLAADDAVLATVSGTVAGTVELTLPTPLDPPAVHRTALVVAGAA